MSVVMLYSCRVLCGASCDFMFHHVRGIFRTYLPQISKEESGWKWKGDGLGNEDEIRAEDEQGGTKGWIEKLDIKNVTKRSEGETKEAKVGWFVILGPLFVTHDEL